MSQRSTEGSSGTSSHGCEYICASQSFESADELIGPAPPYVHRDDDAGDGEEPHGHVVSISVLRSYRRLGLAKKLMVQSRKFEFLCSQSLIS